MTNRRCSVLQHISEILDETVHDVVNDYFDRLGLEGAEREREKIRFGLALLSHAVELSEDLEVERNSRWWPLIW